MAEDATRLILTIGHSTRPLDDFVALLTSHGVTALADVRRFAASRRYPHFAGDALAASLPAHRIAYHHFPGLGGRRPPQRDSVNRGWRHSAFQGYADHMTTPEFRDQIESLLELAAVERMAIMCAEAPWWRCHRRLVADALVARGIEVRHIMDLDRAAAHELTPFARLEGGAVTYPGDQTLF